MSSTVPAMPELIAPAHWRTVEFISDLHLDPDRPATVQAWRDYLSSSQADAIFCWAISLKSGWVTMPCWKLTV